MVVPATRVILVEINFIGLSGHARWRSRQDDESIKHSDVLVEDPEEIKKHAKEPEVLEKKTRN